MVKDPEKLFRSRREEIVTASAKLYETKGFYEITIKDIAEFTSLTRPAIYNYFRTKEEIFLSLLEREYWRWRDDLQTLNSHDTMTRRAFAEGLAHTLEDRTTLLRLLSMNLIDLEGNSREEKILQFKRAYGASLAEVRKCLEHFFPEMDERDIKSFVFSFFPFVYGIYPYTNLTDKQKAVIRKAGSEYADMTLYEFALNGIERLLGV